MASNLLAMASDLLAMASNLVPSVLYMSVLPNLVLPSPSAHHKHPQELGLCPQGGKEWALPVLASWVGHM